MDIDRYITEYFNKEENLHWLRQKVLNLDGYCLQSEVEAKQREIFATKDKEIKDIKSKYEITVQRVEELTVWREKYFELDRGYTIFRKLSSKHQEALSGIFGGCDTPWDFLCGSVQQGHLEQLWDYVCDECNGLEISENRKKLLIELFDYSFNAVNHSQREPIYRRLTIPLGAKFDGDIMRRTDDSSQLGQVSLVIFAGYAYSVTGNIVRRSLIRLE